MKKTILLLTTLTMFLSIFAQEKVKQTEFGLVFNNLDNFGFTIKKGSNKFMWRFNTLLLTGDKQPNADTSTTYNMGFSLSVGNEFKKMITENFEFYFGYDFSYGYSQSKKLSDKSMNKPADIRTSYKTPGFNLVFGFNYVAKDHLVFGAELLPFISRTKTTNYQDISNLYIDSKNDWDELNHYSIVNYGLSNSSVRLLIAYRF